MLEDNIIEVSSSGHLNPLTIVIKACMSADVIMLCHTWQKKTHFAAYSSLQRFLPSQRFKVISKVNT
jgi:hypothetical protein